MNFDTKINNITIVDQGLILQRGKKKELEIPFSEIGNVFIKVNKLTPVCELLFILSPFLIVFMAVQYFALEIVIFFGLSIIVPVFVKINNYKSFGLRICLNDGTVFRKKVTLDVRSDDVYIVNAIRKKQLIHYQNKYTTSIRSTSLLLKGR